MTREEYEKILEERECFVEISPFLLNNELIHWCFGGKIKRVRISSLQKDSGCYVVRFIVVDEKIESNLNWNYPEWCTGYSYYGFCTIKRWFCLNPDEKKRHPKRN